jgi:hypothetical protein
MKGSYTRISLKFSPYCLSHPAWTEVRGQTRTHGGVGRGSESLQGTRFSFLIVSVVLPAETRQQEKTKQEHNDDSP